MDPDRLDVIRHRVRVHLEGNRFDAALRDIGAGLAIDPDDVELLRLRAVALLDSGDPQGSLATANRALGTHPDDATLHLLASMALSRLGQHGPAIAAAETTVRLAPFHAEGHRQLARAHAASGPTGCAPARAAAHRALELEPDEASSHLAMADAIFPDGIRPGRRDLVLAEEHVQAALELEPGDPMALNELARIQMALRRNAAAAGTLSRAVAGSPQEQLLHTNMDIALTNSVALAHWALFLAGFVLVRVGALEEQAQRVTIAVLSVAAVGFIVYRLLSEVRTSRMAYLRGFARRQPLVALWAVLLLATLVLFVLSAALGSTGPQTLGFFCLLAGAILSWVAWSRNRSAT